MGLIKKSLLKSLWVFHLPLSPCNNCDIEILDTLTPRYDLERFGIQLVGSIRHADILLVTGVPNYKNWQKLKYLYEQAPKPCFVVAVGTCACGRGVFKDSYNSPCNVDEIVPVSAYITGCPPKPEAMIDGIVKLINVLKNTK
ncbi:MAG: NADH-quinone oxidoreductase subunit B family protein [Endomicrobiia bacterium]